MSININHPNDDISTSASAPPTLGGQSPLVANNATVTANSSGNVSRWVMDTAASTATYWTKIAEFTSTGVGTARASFEVHIIATGGAAGNAPIYVNLQLYMVETVANGLESLISAVSIIESSDNYIMFNGIKLVQGTAAAGEPVELWIKSEVSGITYSVHEIVKELSGEVYGIGWINGSTWTATTPTGAVTITSDWAGSGPLTSTSLSNSTGTVYYEKSDDGLVTVDFVLTALTTTTDATTYFTMPAGFRHGISGLALDSILSGVIAGGAAGALRMSDVGVVAIYNYAASTGNWRASFRYRARA